MERPLTESEVDDIVSHLDMGGPSGVFVSGTQVPYLATDFDLGEKQNRFMQPDDSETLATEHFDTLTQQQAFRLIKSDARIEQKLRRSVNWIRIPGINMHFYQHQLYAAFWLLQQEQVSARKGAIEGDSMGLGKTATTYLFTVLASLVAANLRDIRRHPGRHLPPEQSTDPGKFCRQRADLVIECACHSRSPAHSWEPREGANLIIVPATLLGTWRSEWDKLGVEQLGLIPMRMYTHHNDFPWDFLAKKHRSELSLKRLDTGHTIQPEGTKTLRLIILTTVESYATCVRDYFDNGRQVRTSNKVLQNDGLAWSRIIKDEAHLTINLETTLYTMLQGLVLNGGWAAPPAIYFLTGTPLLRHGVLDMLNLVRMINLASPALERDGSLTRFSDPKLLKAEAKKMRRLVRRQGSRTGLVGDEGQQLQALSTFFGELLAAYTIRRRAWSHQNGRPLLNIPPLDSFDVSCPPQSPDTVASLREIEAFLVRRLSRAWETELQNWRSEGGQDADFVPSERVFLDNVYLARALATAPGLADKARRRDLTWTEISRRGWAEFPRRSGLFAHMPALINSSGKLQMLQRFLDKLNESVTWDGQAEKLVIISDVVVTCHVVHCFLVHVGMEDVCRWLHANVSTVERQRIIDDFQESGESDKARLRILVGSSTILGQGVTLNAAHRLILMEPSHHAAAEHQAVERIHRIGSRTDRCSFYRFVNPQSRLERTLMKAQVAQSTVEAVIDSLVADQDGDDAGSTLTAEQASSLATLMGGDTRDDSTEGAY